MTPLSIFTNIIKEKAILKLNFKPNNRPLCIPAKACVVL